MHRIQEYADSVEQTTSQPFTPTLQIDAELKPSEVSRTLLRQVEMLYPLVRTTSAPSS